MPTPRRVFCLAVTVAALLFAAGVGISTITGSVYPALPASVTLAAIALVGGALSDDPTHRRYVGYLGALVALAVGYRLVPLLVTDGLIGLDPHWYATQAHAVTDRGTTDVIQNAFYRTAAAYIVLQSVLMQLTGASVETVALFVSIATGVCIPLLGAALAQRLVPPDRRRHAGIVAAAILVVAQLSVRQGFWPIAQTLATITLATFLLGLMRYYRVSRETSTLRRLWPETLLLLTCLVSLALTHKFAPLVTALLLGMIALWHVGHPSLSADAPIRLVLIAAVILLSVWTLSTAYVSDVIVRAALLSEGFGIGGMLYDPAAAVRVGGGLEQTARRQLNWLVLASAAGIAWAWIVRRAWRARSVPPAALPVVFVSALLMVLFAAGIVTGSVAVNPVRVLGSAEVVLAALVGAFVAAAIVRSQATPRRRALALTAVSLILISQTVALGGMIDEPGPRSYLTGSEAAGYEFTADYTADTQTVYTDAYYVRAGFDPTDPPPQYWYREYGAVQWFDPVVFEGHFTADHERVLFRAKVDVYGHLPWGGYWRLSWSPGEWLDGCYDRVYSNGDVDYYDAGQCWGE